MNRQETAHLLGVIALTDQRKLSDELTQMWHVILGDIRIEDALAAVVQHRAESAEWIQPAHIVRLVRIERSRRTANIVYEPVEGETGREYCDRVGALYRAAANGMTEPQTIGRALSLSAPAKAPVEIEAAIEARRAVRTARAVTCPVSSCKASPGNPCSVAGKPSKSNFVHPGRVTAPQNARQTEPS